MNYTQKYKFQVFNSSFIKLYYKDSFFMWWLVKRKLYLSQEQVKIRILAYLYNKGKDGANSYTIQRKATFPHLKNTADSKIF